MPGRQQIPSLQLASGTTDERDLSYNLTTIGSIFYNTDTSNVEVRHEDPSNNVGWRDLVMNNKEQIDISGKITCTTAPTGVNDLTNKEYVDSQDKVTPMSVSQQDINTLFYTVYPGNPSNSDPNEWGGLLNEDSPYESGPGANLQVDVAIPLGLTNFAVAITSRVMGEWHTREFNKGLAIARATLAPDGSFNYTTIFRGKVFSAGNANGLIIAPFSVGYSQNTGSTVENCFANHIDTTPVAGNTYRYTPLLINTDTAYSNSGFGLNRYYTNGSSLDRECGTSTTTAQIIKTG
jgi:hypothetical protein